MWTPPREDGFALHDADLAALATPGTEEYPACGNSGYPEAPEDTAAANPDGSSLTVPSEDSGDFSSDELLRTHPSSPPPQPSATFYVRIKCPLTDGRLLLIISSVAAGVTHLSRRLPRWSSEFEPRHPLHKNKTSLWAGLGPMEFWTLILHSQTELGPPARRRRAQVRNSLSAVLFATGSRCNGTTWDASSVAPTPMFPALPGGSARRHPTNFWDFAERARRVANQCPLASAVDPAA